MHVQARRHNFQNGGYIDKIRCSEIASEAILGQKQSCSSYMAHRVLHPILAVHIRMHLLSQVMLNFHGWQSSR